MIPQSRSSVTSVLRGERSAYLVVTLPHMPPKPGMCTESQMVPMSLSAQIGSTPPLVQHVVLETLGSLAGGAELRGNLNPGQVSSRG